MAHAWDFPTYTICVTVEFSPDAEKRGIPRDEVFYAMMHGQFWDDWEDPRPPHGPTRLWVGPSRFGTLEVIAEITPPDGVWIFHVMPLRQSTADKVGYEEQEDAR